MSAGAVIPSPAERAPAPPGHLHRRVQGVDDLPLFERVGNVVCGNLLDALAGRLTLGSDSRILDFGCGCGRIITHFRRAAPGRLYGTDIDAEAIAWCRQNMAETADFSVNNGWPPLPFADGFFDLVYAVSVFTHLGERRQDAWLGELARVTRPGGYLLATTHGPHLRGAPTGRSALHRLLLPLRRLWAARQRGKLERRGFLYTLHRTPGLPRYYGMAFHDERYIRRVWGSRFVIEAFVPRGIGEYQDLVVCRRPQSASPGFSTSPG